jgi:parallel beta-helix repeat protein
MARAAVTGVALAVLAAASSFALPARAETSACTVVSAFPSSISFPGVFCLDADVSQAFTTSAIAITSSDVVLDCNGHRIRHTDPANSQSGIYIENNLQGVTVRNCVVEGFQTGIYGIRTSDTMPGRNVISGNHVIRARTWGIYVTGSGYLIEDNTVSEVLGNVAGAAPNGILLLGYDSNATGNIVRGNHIGPIRPQPPGAGFSAAGINASGERDLVIADNVISGVYASTGMGVYGIVTGASTYISVEGNVLLTPPPVPAPLDGGFWRGIYLQGTVEEQATNVCRDNVVMHWGVDIQGCTLATNSEL